MRFDYSFAFGDIARFRVNAFHERGKLAAAFRLIPNKIKGINELGMPAIVETFADFPRGLVLVTGPTGSGKSTTLAALVDKINREKSTHLITIEDPIEFVHKSKKSIVHQRELAQDTRSFANAMHEKNIPFILLDSYIPELKPLSFYGQDSFQSGYFAARMLMLIANKENEIMLMKQTRQGRVVSKQQDNRETGFKHYMHDHFPNINITEVDLPLEEDREKYDKILESFFSKKTNIHHCITFTSKAHIVGEFLQRTNRRNIQIMGYDMVRKNAECMRRGSISFLIAQHGYMQGYNCVEALFRAIVLKEEINPVNYMPIEFLTKENVDFYQRTQI